MASLLSTHFGLSSSPSPAVARWRAGVRIINSLGLVFQKKRNSHQPWKWNPSVLHSQPYKKSMLTLNFNSRETIFPLSNDHSLNFTYGHRRCATSATNGGSHAASSTFPGGILDKQGFDSLCTQLESTQVELLQAECHVWYHLYRFSTSYLLKCAVELEIPDIIYHHGQPMIISDLASALSIHSSKLPSLYRLMNILVRSGFFEEQKLSAQNENETKGYVLTLASRLLLKDNPLSIRPYLLAMLDPIFMNPWQHVSAWFRSSDDLAPFNTAHGMNMWDYAGSQSRMNHLFNESMACDGLFAGNMLLSKCKGVFEGLRSLVDVGGGTGTVTKVLAKAFPEMDCVVFDLPHVVAGLQGSDNVKFVGGSMFDHVPHADAVMLKWILHNWDDKDCIKILKVCKEAIMRSKEKGVRSKIIIMDMVIESKEADEQSKDTKLFFDMQMMVCLNGQERNEHELSKLFVDAGFSDYKIHRVLGLRSLIELFP